MSRSFNSINIGNVNLSEINNQLVIIPPGGNPIQVGNGSVENVTGTQDLSPEINYSFCSGSTHNLPTGVTNGLFKQIINLNDNIYGSLGTGVDNTVYALVTDPVGTIGPTGALYAGGQFGSAGGIAANRIARWDGTTWSPLGTGIGSSQVNALVIDTIGSIGPIGNLYAGGLFTTAGGTAANRIARWDGSQWYPLGTGMGSNLVTSLAIDTLGSFGPTGNLYAGGDFTLAGGTGANRIARWDGTTWYPLGTGIGNNTVFALAIDPVGTIGPTGNLYAGGNFTTAGGTAANRIARWDGTGWSPLGVGIGGDIVFSLAIDTVGSIGPIGNLYVAGGFTIAGGTTINRIARWDGTTWIPLQNGIGATPLFLAINPNNGLLYIGGNFTSINNTSQTAFRIATWNGNNFGNVSSGFNDSVRALTFDNAGNLYCGGDFTYFNNILSTNRIAILEYSKSSNVTVSPNLIDSFGNNVSNISLNSKGASVNLIWSSSANSWILTGVSSSTVDII